MVKLIRKLQSFRFGQKMNDSFLEVVDVLTHLRNSGREVTVTFEGDTISYPTTVSAFNAKHRIMVLDSLAPVYPYGLNHGKPLLVTTSNPDRKFTFKSNFIEPVVPDFSMGYEVTIPEVVGIESPRGAVRYLLDEIRNGVTITLKGSDDQFISGFVKNISTLGVGMKTEAELPRFLSKYLSEDQHVVDCEIALDSNSKIDCKMDIRNIQNMVSGEPGTYIGGRMLRLNSNDKGILSNFITQLQQTHLQAVA